MKTLSLALIIAIIPILAPAQQTRSYEVKPTTGGYSVAYLYDGEQGSAGIVLNDLGISLAPRLSLSALYVNSTGADARSYFGSYLSYRAYESKGWALDLGVGLKGVDVTTLVSAYGNASGFRFDPRQLVVGVGVTIPIR